jgi:hypothetical protein
LAQFLQIENFHLRRVLARNSDGEAIVCQFNKPGAAREFEFLDETDAVFQSGMSTDSAIRASAVLRGKGGFGGDVKRFDAIDGSRDNPSH